MDSVVSEWLEVLERYYLADFIRTGGAGFKLLLTKDDQQASEAMDAIERLTTDRGYHFAKVSARTTRVDRIEQVFFAIARQIEWERLMEEDGRRFLRSLGYQLPDGAALTDIQNIADANGCTADTLLSDIRRATNEEIMKDREMCKEFRTAVAQLRRAEFFPRNVTPSETETIRGWLSGEKVSLTALRNLCIYTRIDRHNARHVLRALTRWLVMSTGTGLIVGLDLCGLFEEKPRGVTPDMGRVYYSRSAFLDACEVLREFVDDTDDISHFLICAVAPYEMETGERRSIESYVALKNRLINEVHDRERPNLLAAMVRSGQSDFTKGGG